MASILASTATTTTPVTAITPSGGGGGYREAFIGRIPGDLICPICEAVCRAPEWGCREHHVFCKACLKDKTACIICKQEYTLEGGRSEAKAIDRIIKDLEVRCRHFVPATNTDDIPITNGCKWKGTLQNLETHLQTECAFTLISCPYPGCDAKQLTKGQIEKHKGECEWRPTDCKLCTNKIPFKQMENHVRKECDRRLQTCGLCFSLIEAQKMESHHMQDCEKQIIPCDFVQYGCLHRPTRANLAKHLYEHTHTHLSLVTKPLLLFAAQLGALQGKHDAEVIQGQKTREELAALQKKYDSLRIDEQHKSLLSSIKTVRDSLLQTDASYEKQVGELQTQVKEWKNTACSYTSIYLPSYEMNKKSEPVSVAGRDWTLRIIKEASSDKSKVLVSMEMGVAPKFIKSLIIIKHHYQGGQKSTSIRKDICGKMLHANDYTLCADLEVTDTELRAFQDAMGTLNVQWSLLIFDCLDFS